MTIPKPALWLITLIAGVPLFSETAYSPALPDIARSLKVDESWVEYTLTIYLLAFALGSFVFGLLSDRFGRKPCMLWGFAIYIAGCIGCYLSGNIYMLLAARFVQAFGGSVGSVLGQAICRDAFQGQELGKVYAVVVTAMSLFPAIGPIFGGLMDQYFGWSSIFLALTIIGIGSWFCVAKTLSETHLTPSHQSVLSTICRMLKDKQVLTYTCIVGGANGIMFSYYGEGSFYLIDLLGLSPSQYGMTFWGIALASLLGGYASKRLHDRYTSLQILTIGLYGMLVGALLFSGISSFGNIQYGSALLCMMIIVVGVTMTASNALSLALRDYKDVTGTASALFGLLYYGLVSLTTLIMGLLHNDTVYPMPLYFLALAISMLALRRNLKKRKGKFIKY